MYETLIDQMEHIQRGLKQSIPERIREAFSRISFASRGMMIMGPRGVGKTTLLLNQLDLEKDFYFSADHPFLASISLYAFVESIFMQGYERVMIDEVHYAKDWASHVKGIYDAFPDRSMVISDSSSLQLRQGIADLSRRFPVQRVPYMSFREYVAFQTDRNLSVVNPLVDPLESVLEEAKSLPIMKLYRSYIKQGFRPIFHEGFYAERLMNIIEKTVHQDIPYFVPQISANHMRMMRAVLGFLATSPIPRVQVNTLCDLWELGKSKLYQLLDVMESTGLIRIIRKKQDRSIHSVGEKVFLGEPSMYPLLGGSMANIRESFVATLFGEKGSEVYASDREESYDFLIDGIRVEVGGRSKSKNEADVVIRDDRDLPTSHSIPMWMVGLVY